MTNSPEKELADALKLAQIFEEWAKAVRDLFSPVAIKTLTEKVLIRRKDAGEFAYGLQDRIAYYGVKNGQRQGDSKELLAIVMRELTENNANAVILLEFIETPKASACLPSMSDQDRESLRAFAHKHGLEGFRAILG